MAADLKQQIVFPEEICVIRLPSVIVIWSVSSRQVILREFSVPWEENMEELVRGREEERKV